MARVLAAFGLLMLVLSLLMVMAIRWTWPMVEAYRMAPRVAFEDLPPLPAARYAAGDLWLARPDLPDDPAHTLPPGMPHQRHGRAYVFFVHPTTFMGRNHWNAPLDHADSQMRAALTVRTMASVFNDEAAIWAPRYRQAAMGTLMNDRGESPRALAIAQADVRAAFAAFVAALPADAPIILAGHSQGALLTLALLRDVVRGTALARRVVAVYLPGWRVSPAHDVPQTGLAVCSRADQAGCIMSWITFGDGPDPRQTMAMAGHFPALDGTYPDDAPLCTNPLTGGGGPVAPAGANLGSLAVGDELRQPSLVWPSVGARCEGGLLLVTAPPHLGDQILLGNNLTMYDYALFWRNLRADVARREAAWHRATATP